MTDQAPLPERVRPKEPSHLMGQTEIWGEHSRLYQMVVNDACHSLIFWGPPGTGKTSLARIIARMSERNFAPLSAVSAGVKDIRAAIEESRDLRRLEGKASLMFMDEIHRLNKAQQDILLPALEDGSVRFIGATTENPSFEVNKAILSRSLVFQFKSISTESLTDILKRALSTDPGLRDAPDISQAVLEQLAEQADGDARRALNLLNALVVSVPKEKSSVDLEDLRAIGIDFVTRYDRTGDQHYDIISAMIKSIRGSHPDAALYYLARMIEAGEDAMFIARRLVIAASEDIGNANPTALLVATSAMQAVHMIGYPEARIILSQTVTYLAASPKSNRAYKAIDQALADVRARGSLEVPLHLRNAPTKLMKTLGYGKLYKYAHDDLEGARQMTYLPDELAGRRYYVPSNHGTEASLKANLDKIRPKQD